MFIRGNGMNNKKSLGYKDYLKAKKKTKEKAANNRYEILRTMRQDLEALKRKEETEKPPIAKKDKESNLPPEVPRPPQQKPRPQPAAKTQMTWFWIISWAIGIVVVAGALVFSFRPSIQKFIGPERQSTKVERPEETLPATPTEKEGDQEKAIAEERPKESAFNIDSQVTVVLDSLSTREFVRKLQELRTAELDLDRNEISETAFAIRKEEGFLSLSEFEQKSGFVIPDNIRNLLTEEYSFLILEVMGKKRFGLALKTKETTNTRAFQGWEQTIREDMNAFVQDIAYEDPFTESFQDNTYKGISIRYRNYPDPQKAIDYAYNPLGQLLLITTSREGMFKLIDRNL